MKFLWIIIIFFYITIPAYSENTSADSMIKLDVDTAITKAIEHNFSLKNNKLDNDNYKISAMTAFNKLLPYTGIYANIGNNYTRQTYHSEDPDNFNIETNQYTAGSLSAGFYTTLNFNAKTIFDINQTVIDYKYGIINYQIALKRLTNDTKKFYYNLIILKEQLNLQNNKIKIAKKRYDASILNNNGNAYSEIDKLQNEYDYKSNLFEMKKAEDNYHSNIMQLKQMLGINNSRDIELTSKIPEIKTINYNDLTNQSIDKNYDLQLTNQSLISEINYRNGYIAGMTPSLSLSFSTFLQFNQELALYNWFEDPNNRWDKYGTFMFSISLPLDPLIPFSYSQVSIIKEQNLIKKIKNNLDDQKEKIKLNVAQTIIKLKETEENINILKTNIELANQSYLQVEKLYYSGNKSELDLRDADNTLFNAQIQLLSAKYAYLTNMIDLKYLLNIED